MKPVTAQLQTLASAVEARTAFIYKITAPAITGGAWYYTSLPSSVVIAGVRYASAAISFDRAEKGKGGPETASFTVTAPVIEPFASFCGQRFNLRFDCEIQEIFFDASNVPVLDTVISGQMLSIKRDLTSISAEFKPLASFLAQKVPAVLYSQLDQRIPYTDDFGLTAGQIAALCVDTTATAMDGNKITSPAAALQPDGYYYNGYISYTRSVGGKSITLRVPIINNDVASSIFTLQWEPKLILTEGAKFKVYAGYDGSVSQSKTKFANFLTGIGYLGFPTFSDANWAFTGMEDCANVVSKCGTLSTCDNTELNSAWATKYLVRLGSFSLIDTSAGIPQGAGAGVVHWTGYVWPHGGRSGYTTHGCYPRSGSYWGTLENGQCYYGAWHSICGYLACCDSVMIWRVPSSTTDLVWHLQIHVLKAGSGTGLSYTPDDNTPQTSHMLLWSGEMAYGKTPAGRYERTGGAAGGPEYIDVEAA